MSTDADAVDNNSSTNNATNKLVNNHVWNGDIVNDNDPTTWRINDMKSHLNQHI
jgi:hypothetical protein